MTERELRQANCTYDHSGFICMKCGYVAPPAVTREGLELPVSFVVAKLKEFRLDCLTDMEGADDDEFTEAEHGFNAGQYIAERLGVWVQLQELEKQPAIGNWHKATALQAKGE